MNGLPLSTALGGWRTCYWGICSSRFMLQHGRVCWLNRLIITVHLEVVSMNMIPTKMPYVWRSSFPNWQLLLFPAGAFTRQKTKALGGTSHGVADAVLQGMAATHVAKVKLRNSALNPGVRRIKIAQTIRNMSKYPHIQVCKKYVKHYQTVGDCTCGRFRWAVCSAWELQRQPHAPSPYLHLGTDPWFHLWNLRWWTGSPLYFFVARESHIYI